MSGWILGSDRVAAGVTEEGGHLDPVRFSTERGPVEPMHVAPWVGEPLDPGTPPMLRLLRGDFFCAPFGPSDLDPGEARPHGLPANGRWRLAGRDDGGLELELDGLVLGAQVTKRVSTRPGQAVVYQEHVLSGGSGRLPLGHHAMLRAAEPLLLGFSSWVWGGTPPGPVEPDPFRGRSLLEYPQRFEGLERVRLAAGGTADLSRYPNRERHEDIAMLVADPGLPFAWSAATAPGSGWVWFALKDPRMLRSTVLWMSNGGRDYPPFSGRHVGVLGIEEVTGYFHLGHRASTYPNPLSEQGVPTALDLDTDGRLSVRYVFGLADAPQGFGPVKAIRPVTGGVSLADGEGRETFAAVDLSFVEGGRA